MPESTNHSGSGPNPGRISYSTAGWSFTARTTRSPGTPEVVSSRNDTAGRISASGHEKYSQRTPCSRATEAICESESANGNGTGRSPACHAKCGLRAITRSPGRASGATTRAPSSTSTGSLRISSFWNATFAWTAATSGSTSSADFAQTCWPGPIGSASRGEANAAAASAAHTGSIGSE